MTDNETEWGPRVAVAVVVVAVVIGIVIAIATGNFPRTSGSDGDENESGTGDENESGTGGEEGGSDGNESGTGGEEGGSENDGDGDGKRAFNPLYLILIPVVAVVIGGVAWLARRRPSSPKPALPTITIFNGVGVESSPKASMLTRARQVAGRGLGYVRGVTGLHTMFDPLISTVLPVRPVHEIFWNDSSKVMEAVAKAGNKPKKPHEVRLLIEGDTPPSRDVLIGTRKARRARKDYTNHRNKTQTFVNNLNALSLAATPDIRAAAILRTLDAAKKWDQSRSDFEKKIKVRAPIFNGPRGGGMQVLAIRSALEMSLINEMNAKKTEAEKKDLAEELDKVRGAKTLDFLAKTVSPMPDEEGLVALYKIVTAAAQRGIPPDAAPPDALLAELKKTVAARKGAIKRLVARKRISAENLSAVASFLQPLMEENPVLPSMFSALDGRLKELQEQEELAGDARINMRLSLKAMMEDGAKARKTAREFRRELGASSPTTQEFQNKMTRLAGYKQDREERLRKLLQLVESQDKAAATAREIMASPLTEKERREARKRLDKLIKRMEAAGGGPYLVEAREWRDKLATLVPRDIVQVEALELEATSAKSAKLIKQLKLNMGMQESQLAVEDLDSTGEKAAPFARELKTVVATRVRAQINLAITPSDNARTVLDEAITSEKKVRAEVRGTTLSTALVARVFLVGELAAELEQELTRKKVTDAKLIALEENRATFEKAEAGATAFLEAKTQEITRLLAPPRSKRPLPPLPPRDPPNIRELKKKLKEARQALAEANDPVPIASLEADVAAAEAELNMASNLPTFAETLRQVTELAKADQEYARAELELVLSAPPDPEALQKLTAATLAATPKEAKELEAQRKKLLLERYGSSPLDAINASRALLAAPEPPPQVTPTTGRATAFDWPAIAQQNADLANYMAMGIHNLRVRQRFLSLALQEFPKGSPLMETYIAQMKAYRELMEGSRQIYNKFLVDATTSAYPQPFPQVDASNYTSWGEKFPEPPKREPVMGEDVYFTTLPVNTLATFITEINGLLQQGVEYDLEGLRAVLSATRGITFDDAQMGPFAEEVLRKKVEVIEAYNDRRTYLAELYMLREQADDTEERDDAIARMRRHIEGFEKDLGLEKVSLVDELQTLEHTAQSARVYLANAKLPSLFPTNWEPPNDPALDKAGRELKKLYMTGRATNDIVAEQRGVVY